MEGTRANDGGVDEARALEQPPAMKRIRRFSRIMEILRQSPTKEEILEQMPYVNIRQMDRDITSLRKYCGVKVKYNRKTRKLGLEKEEMFSLNFKDEEGN